MQKKKKAGASRKSSAFIAFQHPREEDATHLNCSKEVRYQQNDGEEREALGCITWGAFGTSSMRSL